MDYMDWTSSITIRTVALGEVGGFAVNQSFLLRVTVYVVIPSLMVFCVLILRPRVNRVANIALSILYALTIIAGVIDEWRRGTRPLVIRD